MTEFKETFRERAIRKKQSKDRRQEVRKHMLSVLGKEESLRADKLPEDRPSDLMRDVISMVNGGFDAFRTSWSELSSSFASFAFRDDHDNGGTRSSWGDLEFPIEEEEKEEDLKEPTVSEKKQPERVKRSRKSSKSPKRSRKSKSPKRRSKSPKRTTS